MRKAGSSRLAIHYHASVCLDENGNTILDEKIKRWLSSLAPLWGAISYYAPSVGNVPGTMTWSGVGQTIQFSPTEYAGGGWWKRWEHIRTCKLRMHRLVADLLLVRIPTPRQWTVIQNAQVPVVLYAVGYPPIGDLVSPKRLFTPIGPIVLLMTIIRRQQMRYLSRRYPVITNSRRLYAIMQRMQESVYYVPTATLWHNENYKREDTCTSERISLLFVGRVCKAKGVSLLLQSVAQLQKAGRDIVLHVVGQTGEGESIVDYQRLAASLDIEHRVVWHGRVLMGKALWDAYRHADIFLLPSEHEGFPRVIWEALAHSVPVICTPVGGIPMVLENRRHALFVQKNSVDALTRAILELITDVELRRRLIRNGRVLSGDNTLESSAQALTAVLEGFL